VLASAGLFPNRCFSRCEVRAVLALGNANMGDLPGALRREVPTLENLQLIT